MKGGDHAPRHNRQRDLFEAGSRRRDFPAAQRSELVRLIEGLLAEAVADGETRVAIDDQRRRRPRMSKITPEHLARQAIVYIRQSTADQVANNLESKRRQYGLADRRATAGLERCRRHR